MDEIDWKELSILTRARVYLLWAILVPLGFVATHFYQRHLINAVWTVIALIGLGYMYKVMPLRVVQMRHIFLAWLVPITIGLSVSGAIFYVHNGFTAHLLGHLGCFWLAVMAVGFFVNGLVDRPSGWYWFAAVLNVVMAALCFFSDAFVEGQYLIAAIVSAWSMLYLWLFRSDAS